MYCKKCQKVVGGKVQFCPYCGDPLIGNVEDTPVFYMKLLCVLFPIIGIIYYFSNKHDQPNKAASYAAWAIGGLIASFIIYGI